MFTVTSAEKAAEEGEKTNDYGVHYANEILFGIALSVFLGMMVFIMRIRTFLKMAMSVFKPNRKRRKLKTHWEKWQRRATYFLTSMSTKLKL